MTDSAAPTPIPDTGDSKPPSDTLGKKKLPVWLFRTILGAIIAVILVVGYLIASVTVPLYWAKSIGSQIGDQWGNSIPLGMFYGFVFSFIPVLVAWQAHHRKLNKWVRISLVVLGIILTIPNLLTLGVLFGTTQTAVNARAIWANSANWFGTWSKIFMVVGVVCAVVVIILSRMWLRRGRKIRAIKSAEKLVRDNENAKLRAARKAAKDQPVPTSDGGFPASAPSPTDTPEA
ncbi:hypothetical protein CVS30_09515 [Arthrobacter psychrolactophilus]|uniref:Permease n=1 Tax=Arthrobacter psychrolactophilus TaxID=92442 RepID=A0A2V5J733_9MICC|nr:hypothetical protein [Arthrobacter psychrolactophilus]PYI38560.1 hypothetical protein CVS30_09515 [Arthrobacter psychrolactophilus]